jgi:hypothetical protein
MADIGQRVERPVVAAPSWAAIELAQLYDAQGAIPVRLEIVGGGWAEGYLGALIENPDEHGAISLSPTPDAEGEAHGSRDILAYTWLDREPQSP